MSQNVTPFLGLHINSPLATESESVGQPVNAWETDLNFEILDTAIQQLSQGGGSGAASVRAVKKSASISSVSVSGGIATFTCKNSFAVGESVDIFNLDPNPRNIVGTVTVLSSGLSSTQFEAVVGVADLSPTAELAGDAAVNAYTFKQSDSGGVFYFGDESQDVTVSLDTAVLTTPWSVTLINTAKTSKTVLIPVPPALMYAGPNSHGFQSSNSIHPQPDFTTLSIGTWQTAELVFDGTNFIVVPNVSAPASGFSNFPIQRGDIVSQGGEDFYFDDGASRTKMPLGVALNDAEDNGTVLVQVSGAAWIQVDDPTGLAAAMSTGACPIAANGTGAVLAQPGDYILGWAVVYDSNNTGQILVAISPSKLPALPVTKSAVAHQFLTSYNAATGTFGQAQPVVGDVTGAEATANKGVAGGYASLDGTGKVPAGQLPAQAVTSVFGRTGDVVAATNDYAAVTSGVIFGNGNEYLQFPGNGFGDYVFCTTSLGTYFILDESALPEFHAQAGSVGAAIDLHSGAMQLTTPSGTTLDFNGASLQADGFTLTDDSGNIEVSGGHTNGGLYLLANGSGDKINLTADAGVAFGVATKLLDGTGAAGTSGQVLSSTGTAVKWITPTVYDPLGAAAAALVAAEANAASLYIPLATMAAHGDIIYENSSLGPVRLPIGTTGQHLTVVGAQPAWTTVVMPNTAAAVTHQFLNSYDATTGNFGQAQPAAADISGLAAIATSGKWSDLQNATAALTLANGTNGTTFNQTSAVTWGWANTTAATGSTAPTLVSSEMVATTGTGAQTNGSAINTTGATLLVAVLVGAATTLPTISDGQNNTWNYTAVTSALDNYNQMRVAYAFSHAGGALATSASHTFTVAAGANAAGAAIYAFSGTKTDATVFDVCFANPVPQNSPMQLGEFIPAAGTVVVAAICQRQNTYTTGAVSGNGFGNVFTGTPFPMISACLLNAPGTPVNPLWTFTASTGAFNSTGILASFKSAAVAAQATPVQAISGTYWNGSASAVDTWSYQSVVGNGANASSALVFTHTGSSGPALVQVPALNIAVSAAGVAAGLGLNISATAAATSTVNQSSPALMLTGNYFNYGASQPDFWSLQNVITAPHLSSTVTNISESAANVVTLTITGGNFVTSSTTSQFGDWVTLTGLTTGTWLNGLQVQLTGGNGTTSITFVDPTAHGAQGSASETGQVTQSNPSSILQLFHNGTGPAQIAFNTGDLTQLPGQIYPLFTAAVLGNTTPALNTFGFQPGQNIAVGLEVFTSPGSLSPIRCWAGGVIQGLFQSQTTALNFGMVSSPPGSNVFTNGNVLAQVDRPCASAGNVTVLRGSTPSGMQVGFSAGSTEIVGGNFSSQLTFSPTSGNCGFAALRTNPTINQGAAISNTIVGTALVTNVGVAVFSTANAYVPIAGVNTQVLIAAGTNTALNGYQQLLSQAQRAGSPYTITNSSENSSSVVTLTVGSHNVVTNDWIFVTGLTTASWLNGQTVKVSSVVANSTISFTDLTAHGTSASHADTGTVACNYLTWSQTHANITGSADTGTAVQQGAGNYTAILANVVETAVFGPANLLLDLQAGTNGSGAANTSYASISSRGTLKTAGGRIVNRVAKSGNYTSTAIDYVITFTATATLTLDSAAAVAGTMYRVKLSTSAAGGSVLTLSPNNSKTIDGAATLVINALGGAVDVVYDGASNWEIF